MNRVKVSCEVTTYDTPAKPNIRVHTHWNEMSKVEIEINGERITVVAKDLIAAVENCTHTAGY